MKKIALFTLMVFALAFSVSAWHCTDSDESVPPKVNGTYGPWGDDALLGGTSYGYLDKNVALPEGCTGTKVWTNNQHTRFYYKNVVCDDKCDGFTLTEYYCDDRPRYRGETVMFWNTYENSQECGYEEVPEFGVIAAMIAVLGALGIFVYSRKN